MGKLLMKMAVLLQGHAFCAWTAMDPSGYFFFEKPSLIDFQIGTGRKREFRAAELRFSLHKEFCAAEIRFYLYKEYVGAIWKEIVILLSENNKLVAHGQIFNILQNFPRCEQLGGDASGNGDFQRRKQRLQGQFVSGAFILYSVRNEQLGAMRQKMAIFKERNSVCRVQMF